MRRILKSHIVTRAAQRAGTALILSHPAVVDHADSKGLPWITTTVESRIARAVTQRLGVTAVFLRWQRDTRTGADLPVLGVPSAAVRLAASCGFEAWQFEAISNDTEAHHA